MALTRKSMPLTVPEQPRAHLSAPEDPLRQMLTTLVQETLEREFTRFVGAAPHERTVARTGWRNGHRRRRFTTRVGTLELRVPRDRAGHFQPSLFARYERSEQALVSALVEMYVHGVSTRKVTRIVHALCGARVSSCLPGARHRVTWPRTRGPRATTRWAAYPHPRRRTAIRTSRHHR